MEQHRDDHIVCADCGASFLFSAGEAAVFAERGLASPKRCKDCRRARKERGGDGGARRAGPPRTSPNGHDGGFARPSARGPRDGSYGMGPQAPRYGAPQRYTGDVNEYRSPMQDNRYAPAPWRGGAPAHDGAASGPNPRAGRAGPDHGPRGPRGGAPRRWNDDGNYRAPSAQADGRSNGFGRADRSAAAQPPAAQPPAARRRPQAEKFSSTCDSCGAQAEVPFKPAEGREVFCQACYRARKPA
jgi:CxxC-x17-CxxC domain-containing protein